MTIITVILNNSRNDNDAFHTCCLFTASFIKFELLMAWHNFNPADRCKNCGIYGKSTKFGTKIENYLLNNISYGPIWDLSHNCNYSGLLRFKHGNEARWIIQLFSANWDNVSGEIDMCNQNLITRCILRHYCSSCMITWPTTWPNTLSMPRVRQQNLMKFVTQLFGQAHTEKTTKILWNHLGFIPWL